MTTKNKIFEVEEVRKRAAEIRRHWSPKETLRRTGLPPDMPPKLQHFFAAPPERAWCTAVPRGASPNR
jgi:hypothetical protein